MPFAPFTEIPPIEDLSPLMGLSRRRLMKCRFACGSFEMSLAEKPDALFNYQWLNDRLEI